MEYFDKIAYPESAGYIIDKLDRNGFEAFLVGGCVRDSILGREPYDWDIATNALPEDIKRIFDKTYDTGIRHGTVSVAAGDGILEVTTYRIDGEYTDFRRPDNVSFTADIKEDLARRDFTVNAMAYSPRTGLVDYFDGLRDLNDLRIRAVGDAGVRFLEDALRMLRAVRFSAQLDFSIDKATFDAIKENSGLIRNICRERIRDELNKILTSANPANFNLLYEAGLLDNIIPEFTRCYKTGQNNPYHVYDVAQHILHAVEYVENSSILRWTMLLHDIGKPPKKTTDANGIDHFYGHQEAGALLAGQILNRLRFDKDSIKKIVRLIQFHDIDIFDTEKSVRRVVSKVGEDLFLDLLEVQKADAMAQNHIYLDKRLIKLDNIKKIFGGIKEANQCLKKADMAVNGHDLISLGMKPGRELKDMLNYLFESVLEDPELNERQKLIDMAKKGILRK